MPRRLTADERDEMYREADILGAQLAALGEAIGWTWTQLRDAGALRDPRGRERVDRSDAERAAFASAARVRRARLNRGGISVVGRDGIDCEDAVGEKWAELFTLGRERTRIRTRLRYLTDDLAADAARPPVRRLPRGHKRVGAAPAWVLARRHGRVGALPAWRVRLAAGRVGALKRPRPVRPVRLGLRPYRVRVVPRFVPQTTDARDPLTVAAPRPLLTAPVAPAPAAPMTRRAAIASAVRRGVLLVAMVAAAVAPMVAALLVAAAATAAAAYFTRDGRADARTVSQFRAAAAGCRYSWRWTT